ncbi:amidohydrolase family protein [Prescottella equi]|uniref:amidohydrolase family protein n=1 Tax=Rhodococcus hoagii TaxID=43767 RepID=UPI000A0FECBD|nr:amidohydrolase family protein [Prescottella equi]ORJ92036.1 amidohydrolase [Prescottella equi]
MTFSPDDTPPAPDGDSFAEMVDALPLVDHHCHGVLRRPLDRAGFESFLTEAAAPGRWHGSLFDTQAGAAVRSLCAPVLDLDRHAGPDEYLDRRTELGVDEVTRRLLDAAGISEFLVDTGFLPDRLTAPDELADFTGGVAHEVVRLESVAEDVIAGHNADAFAPTCRARLADASRTAVAFKTVAAYRVGLDLAADRPSDAAVFTAAARWAADVAAGRPVRLHDETLVRFLFWTAVDLGLPIQLHVGYGDADTDLHRADPLLLMPLLRATAGRDVPIMLLHNYPFHRNAGYLAQVFDHVFVDVGLAVQNVGGGGAARILAELLELAPFGSVLFSTDGCGLPELFHVAAVRFRRALAAVLDAEVARRDWSRADARRVARMIAADNARRAYRLGSNTPPTD